MATDAQSVSFGRRADAAAAPVSRRRLLVMLGAGAGGGIVTGGAVGAWFATRSGAGGQLETVPTAALPEVEGTLAPAHAARLVEAARRCREPLARIAIWRRPGTPEAAVSIISGTYQSPSFPLTTTPSLVALPFPARYASGRGRLTVVGDAHEVGIALRPPMHTAMHGTLLVNVWWTPRGGCP